MIRLCTWLNYVLRHAVERKKEELKTQQCQALMFIKSQQQAVI